MARAKISDLRKRIAQLEMELRACSATVAALWDEIPEPLRQRSTLCEIGQAAVRKWKRMEAAAELKKTDM